MNRLLDLARPTRRDLAAGGLLLSGLSVWEPADLAPVVVPLPGPQREGGLAVPAALARRRSVRHYAREALTLAEAAQLAWAAQGQSHEDGRRTAPSAGALYPLELYLAVGEVDDLPPGVYRYLPSGHALVHTGEGDRRSRLAAAAHRQESIAAGALVLAVAGVYQRTAVRYGSRAERYVHIEVGHAAQNVYLQAVALDLGTVMVGAFDDDAVATALGLPAGERPLALLPVGRR
jgi:SagB-type dehydrogenase family enzyme